MPSSTASHFAVSNVTPSTPASLVATIPIFTEPILANRPGCQARFKTPGTIEDAQCRQCRPGPGKPVANAPDAVSVVGLGQHAVGERDELEPSKGGLRGRCVAQHPAARPRL